MMEKLRLYMILLGCKPDNRFTEQHDIFFGIGTCMADLKTAMQQFWPEPERLHIDAWREVTVVDDHRIVVVEKKQRRSEAKSVQLFFVNLGGYKENEFDEFHYKVLTLAGDSGEAVRNVKETTFYKHTGFEGAVSHIDDKYGVDVDDVMNIEEILSQHYKDKYELQIVPEAGLAADTLHLGYLKWEKI